MRNATTALLVLGILLSLVSESRAQEKSVVKEKSANEPLHIINDCIQAIQQRDFARYVDHLSEAEQKLQAGYALFLSSSVLPQVDVSAEIDPETLLLLRAVGNLINEHTKHDLVPNPDSPSPVDAAYQLVLSQVIVPTMSESGVGYVAPQAVSGPRVRDVFRKSADKALKDPRLFLIATLTEFERPVQFTGTAPVKKSEIPALAELAKLYERQDWTLYTRGDYALAVPTQRDAKPETPSQPKPPTPAQPQPRTPAQPERQTQSQPEETAWPLRIEFQKIDGTWKISHMLPMSMFASSTLTSTALCSGPECKAPAPSYINPPAPTYSSP